MDLLVAENLGFGKLDFSKNRIEKNIDAADLLIIDRSKLRYFLTLQVPTFVNAGTWEDLPVMDAVEEPLEVLNGATIAKGAFFSIETILNSLVMAVAPEFGQNKILPIGSLVQPYRCKVRVENNGVIVGAETIGAVEYVMHGGLDEKLYPEWKHDFFGEFLKKGFLSYNTSKRVLPKQPVYLYFLNNLTPTPQALKLRCYRWYSDGTEDVAPVTVAVQTSQYMTAYSVPVGVDMVSGLLSAQPGSGEKKLKEYMVWLVNEDNAVVTDMVSYVVDHDYYEDVRYILFRNSLGGYDSLACTGRISERVSVSKETAERYSPYGALASFSEVVVNKVIGTRELTVTTGWLTSAERNWLQELIFSEDVKLVTDREYIPLNMIDDGYVNYDVREDLIGRTMVFEYSNRESSFSKLPVSEKKETRATGWRAYGNGACQVDGFGKRTGKMFIGHLQKYYLDDDSAVKPLEVKLNSPGTDGYLDPQVSAACAGDNHLNVLYSAMGTFKRATCLTGWIGGYATISIAGNRWGSEDSVAAANAKALAEWGAINTQAYADANGPCVELANNGVVARYWNWNNNATHVPSSGLFDTPPVATRNETVIDLATSYDAPPAVSVDYYNISGAWVFDGYIKAPITGAVTFRVDNNAGARLWIGGVKVVDFWENQSDFLSQCIKTITLEADKYYKLKVEGFKYGEKGGIALSWSYAGQSLILVPNNRLYRE